jgi:Zn-dependent peptidase ImmA (M78 family)
MRSSKITVKGQPYKIIFQNHMSSGGLNFPGDHKIVINKELPAAEQMEKLVHELLHALFQENSWDMALESLVMEETMIYELTKFFFSIHKAIKAFEAKK